jgi:hypothetical protein
MLVSVLALFLYSLKFLSLTLNLRTLPVNLFLLLLLDFLLALELVSNKSAASRSESTTDKRPRDRMANGTADKTPGSGSSQSPDCCPFLCGAHARAAKKSHHEWQSYKSGESVSHMFSFRCYSALDGTQSSCQLRF